MLINIFLNKIKSFVLNALSILDQNDEENVKIYLYCKYYVEKNITELITIFML